MSHPLLAETKTLLSDLVSFNTEPSLTNLPLVERVQAYLDGHKLPNSVQLNETGDKASLLSTIGPATDGGVVLSGHTDVVDALGQQWQSPPFELTERDGKLYGRGSCDMKGFLACILAQAPVFAAANIKKPVHIALSRDEEIGSLGMPEMLELIRQGGLTPAVAIVGEPTQMSIVAGHKAGYEMRTVFTGTPAHSALPDEGTSAIVAAAQFAVYLADLSDEMATQPQKGSPFVPPHGIINVGVIRGGTARNIIAGRCEVEWHYRPLPNDDAEQVVGQAHDYAQQVLLPMMRAKGHAADVETLTEAFYPGLTPQADSPAVQLVQALLGEDDYTVAPYGADSGHFQQSGIPAVLIGPGSIAQAHKPDEFIDEEELNRCLYFLDNLCAYLSG